jgi:hypothetical protein
MTATVATLTLAELREIAAGGKTRQYKPTIITFVKSGEIYQNVMDDIAFADKKIDSVYNSFNNNLKTLKSENENWPHIEVKKEGNMVLLINMTALQGAADEISE